MRRQRFTSAVLDVLKLLGRAIYRIPYIHGVLETIFGTVRGFFRDDCYIMAAAISFYALLSLIPFLLLLSSIAGYVLETVAKKYASQEELFAHLAEYIKVAIPFTSEDLMERLRGLVIHRETYGLTGLALLLIASGLVFRTLELAFNRVYKTDSHRSLFVHQALFILFALGIGLVFLLAHVVSLIGGSIATGRGSTLGAEIQRLLAEYASIRLGLVCVTGTVVFTILLKYFSNERVRNRAAITGGLLFAVLWTLAAKLFALYLTHIARFSALYGSFASLAVVVVWLFYAACLLLLCAEFASVLQHRFWPVDSAPKT